ncbi:MAG TPA: hypothetical protein PKK60_03040 [archaeon]|nr:hypothetical protein [archaeon]
MMKKIVQIIIVILILGVILITPMFLSMIPKEIINEYGLLLIIIPIILAIILFIIFLIISIILTKIKNTISKTMIKSKSHNEREFEKVTKGEDYSKFNEAQLKQKRDLIKNELIEFEKQFLKNKISKDLFDNTSKEKHEQLIKIETLLDSKKKIDLSDKEIKKINEVSNDKKKILKGLFEQKLLKLHELNLTEQTYLKRKIDETIYLKISSNIKKEIISIDSQINSITKQEEINKLKSQLKDAGKEILKQKRNTKTRNLEEIIQDDLFEQLKIK